MKGRRIVMVAGIAAGFLLAAGILHLFFMRFRTGDIYPPYSSLRGDPLGTKVLYESLSRCGLASISRNYRPAEKLDPGADTTILFLGDTILGSSKSRIFDSDLVGTVNSQLRKGVRIVITLLPRNVNAPGKPEKKKSEAVEKEKVKEPRKDKKKEKKKEKKADDTWKTNNVPEKIPLISFHDWFGADVGDIPVYGTANATLNPDSAGAGLPPSISCHTSLCFTNLDSNWKVIYRRGGRAVIIERPFGKGSIVLSALSYFASNEALLYERHPALLSWLVGHNRKIIFDENHLGLSEDPGVAGLMKKYNLYWLVAGFLVLALLFIWQNSVSLVPSNARKESFQETAKGKDSTTGLVNLLRRNIPQASIIRTCVDEWKKSANLSGREAEIKLARIDGLADLESRALPGRHRSVETYGEICRILKEDAGAAPAAPAHVQQTKENK